MHAQPAPIALSTGDEALAAAVRRHVEDHIGPVVSVLGEEMSTYVRVDLLVTADHTVVTCGMAERPMADGQSSELLLRLPPEEHARWPFELLRDLARLPHEYCTTLWVGDSVPNGDPPGPYAPATAFSGALVAPLDVAPLVHAGRTIELHAVWPLYAEEQRLALDAGGGRLHARLAAAGVDELLRPDRPNVAPRRRRLFRR